MAHVYEISVCPFCGAQCTYDGGYEGEGWEFTCEHKSYMDEYGEVEPLVVPVEAPGLLDALAKAIPELAAQRQEHMAEQARREHERLKRWNALSPEDQERELRQAAAMRNILQRAYAPMLTEMVRDRHTFWRGGHWQGKTAVFPKFESKDVG